MKQDILETDVGHCVTSLKRNLHDLHAMDGAHLEMAQPNGLRYVLQLAFGASECASIACMAPNT